MSNKPIRSRDSTRKIQVLLTQWQRQEKSIRNIISNTHARARTHAQARTRTHKRPHVRTPTLSHTLSHPYTYPFNPPQTHAPVHTHAPAHPHQQPTPHTQAHVRAQKYLKLRPGNGVQRRAGCLKAVLCIQYLLPPLSLARQISSFQTKRQASTKMCRVNTHVLSGIPYGKCPSICFG